MVEGVVDDSIGAMRMHASARRLEGSKVKVIGSMTWALASNLQQYEQIKVWMD